MVGVPVRHNVMAGTFISQAITRCRILFFRRCVAADYLGVPRRSFHDQTDLSRL